MTDNAINRNGNWKWALPTEDEWYKAAYYRGGSTNAGYWLYPTTSNSIPSNDLLSPDGWNNANFYQDGAYTLLGCGKTSVGEFELSASPYGTFDQGGNVWEWNETVLFGSYRGKRGGSYTQLSQQLLASRRCAPARRVHRNRRRARVPCCPGSR